MKQTPLSRERAVKIERPKRHYTLLTDTHGRFLGADTTGVMEVCDDADDAVLWEADNDGGYRHLLTGHAVTPTSNIEFSAHRGPAHKPSDYLSAFRDQGWVCLPAILDPDLVADLERTACSGPHSGKTFDFRTPPLLHNASVAKASLEPVSLWLTRQYMATPEIRFAHSPSFAILSPDDGKRDVQGWHSDFPYLWGITRKVGGNRVPTQTSGDLVLAVQRNICVSEFTKAAGATCFKLGSHHLNQGPPEAWGTGADYSKPGYREQNGLPYDGPDADTIEAPAGSIILYDARTWHRAGVNRTTQRRAAILQAVTPMYIMPFRDTSRDFKQFIDSPLANELTGREKMELETLMVHNILGPSGAQAITVDDELTARITERMEQSRARGQESGNQ